MFFCCNLDWIQTFTKLVLNRRCCSLNNKKVVQRSNCLLLMTYLYPLKDCNCGSSYLAIILRAVVKRTPRYVQTESKELVAPGACSVCQLNKASLLKPFNWSRSSFWISKFFALRILKKMSKTSILFNLLNIERSD